MLITVKMYSSGRTALSKAVLDALGVGEGDLVEIRVGGYTTTVPIRSTNRVTIPSQIRNNLDIKRDDLIELEVGVPAIKR